MKTHPLSVTHLVIGLVFLGIAGSWALHAADVIDAEAVTWLFPAALVVAGGVGLVAAMAKGVTGRRGEATPYETDSGYQPRYDPPLPQDYTSDLDRKLSEAETTAVVRTADPGEESTTVLPTEDHDDSTDTTTGDSHDDKGDDR